MEGTSPGIYNLLTHVEHFLRWAEYWEYLQKGLKSRMSERELESWDVFRRW